MLPLQRRPQGVEVRDLRRGDEERRRPIALHEAQAPTRTTQQDGQDHSRQGLHQCHALQITLRSKEPNEDQEALLEGRMFIFRVMPKITKKRTNHLIVHDPLKWVGHWKCGRCGSEGTIDAEDITTKHLSRESGFNMDWRNIRIDCPTDCGGRSLMIHIPKYVMKYLDEVKGIRPPTTPPPSPRSPIYSSHEEESDVNPWLD